MKMKPRIKRESTSRAQMLRRRLVKVALEWERYLGVAPGITSAISELDASRLVKLTERDFCEGGLLRTAVTKDIDFVCNTVRYQVTANRPSGKKGSAVTLVSQKTEKKRAFGWDRLIWILYDRSYEIQEAWEFSASQYRRRFRTLKRLSPQHMRLGKCLYPRKGKK